MMRLSPSPSCRLVALWLVCSLCGVVDSFSYAHHVLRVPRARAGVSTRGIVCVLSEQYSVSSTAAVRELWKDGNVPDARQKRKQRPLLIARILNWLICRFISTRARAVSGLRVQVHAPSNRAILGGRLEKVVLHFDELFWDNIQVTGGSRFQVSKLDIRLTGFIVKRLAIINKAYEIHGDFTLTQADVINSNLIRDIMQVVVNAILKHVLPNSKDLMSVLVQRVQIKNRRFYFEGKAAFANTNTGVPFSVVTSLGVKEGGHVLYLRQPEVVLNPGSLLQTVVPLLIPVVDVDLGEDFRIEGLIIDNKRVRIRACTVISPVDPFLVSPRVKKALYKYDVAALLSSLVRERVGQLLNRS